MSIHNLEKQLERAQSAFLSNEDHEQVLVLKDAEGWEFMIGERRTNNDGSSDFMDALKVMINEWKLNAFKSGWIKPGGVYDKGDTNE